MFMHDNFACSYIYPVLRIRKRGISKWFCPTDRNLCLFVKNLQKEHPLLSMLVLLKGAQNELIPVSIMEAPQESTYWTKILLINYS